MKAGSILIIIALFIQYVSDFTFVYQTSRGTFVVGKFVDLFYLTAYFMMAIALAKFLAIYNGVNDKNQANDSLATDLPKTESVEAGGEQNNG